jgi:hypothetical protein
MKLEFTKRPTGKKSMYARISAQFENFFYHWRNGKSIVQAWCLAKKTF